MSPGLPSSPLDANQVSDVLNDWLVQEIKASTARYYDLGKFLFGVSAGSMIYFATVLQAFGGHDCSIAMLAIATGLFTVAIFASIMLVWPPSPKIGHRFDVHAHFNTEVKNRRRLFVVWVMADVLGMGAGLLSLVYVQAACAWVTSAQ